MRKKLNATILLILLAAANVLAKEGTLESRPIDLIIIRDTSWSTDRYRSDFSSLSRQGVSSLEPGDYLEVITAETGTPKLRIAQFMKSGDSHENQNIYTILKSIRCPFLSDARIDDALEMTVKRLDSPALQGPDRKSIVIVLTNGQLQNNEAEKVCQLAADLRKRNCQLYLTGTSQTNKTILTAASQGQLNWCLISQSNLSLWIRNLRKGWPTDEEEKPLTRPAPETTKEQVIITAAEPNETEAHEIQQDHVDGSAKDDQTAKAKFSFKCEIEGPISVLRPQESLPSEAVIEGQDIPEEPTEFVPDSPEEAEAEQLEEPPEPLVPVETETEESPSTVLWWILVPVAALLASLGLILSKGMRNAKQWKAKVSSHFRKAPRQNSGILVAKLNGQSYRLGQLDRFKAINIGSGPDNTIRVPDKSIQSRHVRIYRKGNNLMLRNLAKSPVRLNGTEVKPGGKHHLVLPSVIKLNDKVQLNLQLVKQTVTTPQNRSTGNETGK